MLALEVELLTGRYVATAYNDRRMPEWPPHPARLFSALVATWADGVGSRDEERAALEWLERATPPSICASTCSERSTMTHYVPVNDVTVLPDLTKARDRLCGAEALLDEARLRLRAAETNNDDKEVVGAHKGLEKAQRALERERERFEERTAAAIAAGAPTRAAVKQAERTLPQSRTRQPRHFPSVTPGDPRVVFVWEEEPPDQVRSALLSLVARVVRLGHSSSLVRCSLVADLDIEPAWNPDEQGRELIRVPLPGQLERLQAAFEQHREIEPRVLPCRFQPYRLGPRHTLRTNEPCPVLGEDWVVFRRVGGPVVPITRVVDVAEAVRGALLKYASDPPPEALSGHQADGRASTYPHVAVAPLPFVGSAHSDGRILGLAVILPRDLDPSERNKVLRAIGRWEEAHRLENEEAPQVPVTLGRAGLLELERIAWGESTVSGLRPSTWCLPARVWLSATPIALDRNPGNLHARDPARAAKAYREAETSIATACTNIGLPEPIQVTVLPSITMPGVAKAHQHPPFAAGDNGYRRVKVHTRVEFAEPVRGPVILGAGRYYGLGLMRPSSFGMGANGGDYADS
jgi:CRISPR-associated protein Csb2